MSNVYFENILFIHSFNEQFTKYLLIILQSKLLGPENIKLSKESSHSQ